jgi:hypothetical protein
MCHQCGVTLTPTQTHQADEESPLTRPLPIAVLTMVLVALASQWVLQSEAVGLRSTDKPSAVPERLFFNLGHAYAGSERLWLEGRSLHCERSGSRGKTSDVLGFPSETRWAQFRHELDQLRVWNWRERYVNPHIDDGTQWYVEVTYSDKKVISGGSNGYPLADGQFASETQPSISFRHLIVALKVLARGCL